MRTRFEPNISKTVRGRGLVLIDHQQEMTYGESNCHVTNCVALYMYDRDERITFYASKVKQTNMQTRIIAIPPGKCRPNKSENCVLAWRRTLNKRLPQAER